MALILELVVTCLGGFALHRFYYPTLKLERWGTLLRYAIGVCGTLPFFLLVYRCLYDETPHIGLSPEDARKLEAKNERRMVSSYLLAFLSFGSGSMLGHLVDRVSEKP